MGIITNIITFPPCFLLIMLFRKSRKRSQGKSSKIKWIIRQAFQQTLKYLNKFGLVFRQLKCCYICLSSFSFDDACLEKNSAVNPNEVTKKKKTLSFPWWTKIIAYGLSYLFMCVSLLFIILKGIEFGDEKVLKWLTSLIMSILTSVLLTEPIKVE